MAFYHEKDRRTPSSRERHRFTIDDALAGVSAAWLQTVG
jgi:hypothetical protein